MAKLSQAEREMLERADAAVESMADDYEVRLIADLAELDNAISSGDREQTLTLAHTIAGQAGTFDWPLISQAAGWLRRLLEEKDTIELSGPEVSVFSESLKLMHREEMKGERPDGLTLIRQLHLIMEKAEIS